MNRYNSQFWNASHDFKVTKGMVEEPIFIDQFIQGKLESQGFKKGTPDYKQIFDSVMRVSKYDGKYYDKNEVSKNITQLIDMNQEGKKYIESQKGK
jgi:methionyl-tRNA synthetase